METDGYLYLWRRFFDHPYWLKPRRFSEAEAWIDLLRMAAFRDREIMVGVTRIQIARGEFLASSRYLSKRWKWSRGKVQRFLDAAKTAQEIDLKTSTPDGATYRIVKYETYQNLRATQQDQQRASNGPPTDQRRRKVKKEKKELPSPNGVGWTAQAGELWIQHFGGTANFGEIGKHFKPLIERYGDEEVLAAWQRYLGSAKIEAQFKSPAGFAQKFGEWRQKQKTAAVSVDDIRRCLRLGGSMLSFRDGRPIGFLAIEEHDPALWERCKDILPTLDLRYLGSLSDFDQPKAIASVLANV